MAALGTWCGKVGHGVRHMPFPRCADTMTEGATRRVPMLARAWPKCPGRAHLTSIHYLSSPCGVLDLLRLVARLCEIGMAQFFQPLLR
jgi:hypothetical protein